MQFNSLIQCAKWLGIPYTGPDVSFNSISTDTRTLQKGGLFIALEGSNFDGHHFLEEAFQKKAVAALVQKPTKAPLLQLQVPNTTKALGTLAQHYRSQFSLPIIALTGSCGKTTTKEYLKNILNQAGSVLASFGSFNNEIGVPLTLLQLKPEHQFAVLEVGANAMGEIDYLTKLLQPNIAMILNVSAAHLAGFGSLPQVAQAKSEIFHSLDKNGLAIVHEDFAQTWAQHLPSQKTYRFGQTKKADIYAHATYLDKEGRAHFLLKSWKGNIDIHLPLLGLHQVDNALAAATAALTLNLSLTQIKQGLETTKPVPGRTILHVTSLGASILDDTYNAAPNAVRAAIDLLANYAGCRILVLGDMAELGEDSQQYHAALGAYAYQKGIDMVFTCGTVSQFTSDAFQKKSVHFTSHTDLIKALQPLIKKDTTVLVKGSRMARMEQVVAKII